MLESDAAVRSDGQRRIVQSHTERRTAGVRQPIPRMPVSARGRRYRWAYAAPFDGGLDTGGLTPHRSTGFGRPQLRDLRR